MITLLSPAKTLDFTPRSAHFATKPAFLAQANALAKRLAELSPSQLARLMNISPKLAEATHQHYANWKSPHGAAGSKAAILAFKGDVYLGLEADRFSESDLDFAQSHLRIVSGLYGVLRPLDLIRPYRLEMGAPLKGPHGKDLYAHWGDQLARCLKKELESHASPVVVNLASQEYFTAVGRYLDCPVITPSFRDLHDGKFKVLSFFAKKARGLMARYLVERRVDSPETLTKFRTGGYRYNRELSTAGGPVFTRDKPAPE